MNWVYDDGGRKASGYKGDARDCVCRAVAIATGWPYQSVYELIGLESRTERAKPGKTCSSARTGVYKGTTRKLMARLGWKWVPIMGIGTGCTMHLKDGEIPTGRIIVKLSGHVAAIIDGVLHDTFDCSRNGTRCVYGYWVKP